jgi:hypothetical protein
MTIYTISEAKPHHVGMMLRRLRPAHLDALKARSSANPHQELKRVFDDSAYRKVGFADDQLVAMWGVMGQMVAPIGFIWILFSEAAVGPHIMKTMRVAKQELIEIEKTRPLGLMATVLEDDQPSWRFAKYFGFDVQPEVDVMLPDGMKAFTYAPRSQ